mmetsp:Transcript_32283/g.31576  ORF Transcript_32283/g.31576 Transcript_32283/m.31576 type:complete len:338 (-) Transcript_32283:201-1214(-)
MEERRHIEFVCCRVAQKALNELAFILGAWSFEEQGCAIDGRLIFVAVLAPVGSFFLQGCGLDLRFLLGTLGRELQEVRGTPIVELVQILRSNDLPLDERGRKHLLRHPQDGLVSVRDVIKGRPRLVEVAQIYLLGSILFHIAGVLGGEAVLGVVGMDRLRVGDLLLFEGIWAIVLHIWGAHLEGVLGLEGVEWGRLEEVIIEAHGLEDIDAFPIVLAFILAGEGSGLLLVVVDALVERLLSSFVGIGGRCGHHEEVKVLFLVNLLRTPLEELIILIAQHERLTVPIVRKHIVRYLLGLAGRTERGSRGLVLLVHRLRTLVLGARLTHLRPLRHRNLY